jgi:hypothetical protein
MKQESTTQITAALAYLMAKNPSALQALDNPIPVIGRSFCIWLPSCISMLAFDLPALEKGIRI